MKKLICIAVALLLLGQVVGKYDWFLGTIFGIVGLMIPMVLLIIVLFVGAARKGY